MKNYYVAICSMIIAPILLTGCSFGASDESSNENISTSTESSEKYSAEFDSMRAKYIKNTFTQEVLADNRITDVEINDLQVAYKNCLNNLGVYIEFHKDGSEKVGNIDGGEPVWEKISVAQDDCEEQIGYEDIDMLFTQIRKNPSNEDKSVLMAECLKRVGAAPPEYTADDFRHENKMNGEKDFSGLVQKMMVDGEDQTTFMQCQNDPLGILGG